MTILQNRVMVMMMIMESMQARMILLISLKSQVILGPRLQMLLDDEDVNKRIEHDFQVWAKRTRLPAKLRTIRMARCQDGEAFIILAQNPKLKTNVRLDLQLIEADRVTDDELISDERRVDGITFDIFGNPVSYRVLKFHPGGTESFNTEFMLFAHLRRFTLAVVSAAEAAADFAGILYTDAPANGEADSVEAMDTIQLERNMLLTMPGGWKMSQVDPKQPVTTYGEFKHEILNEIARCLSMPYNIAAGNSSGYNYASGRLDHHTYYKSLKVDRAFMEAEILDRVFDAWMREWSLATATQLDACDCRHVWFWDGQEHVDPAKEANAQEKRLLNKTTTLAAEYARQGKDWETELRQIAKERTLMKELGIDDVPEKNESQDENEGEEDGKDE